MACSAIIKHPAGNADAIQLVVGVSTFESCSSSSCTGCCSRLKLGCDSATAGLWSRCCPDCLNLVKQGVPNNRQSNSAVGHSGCCRCLHIGVSPSAALTLDIFAFQLLGHACLGDSVRGSWSLVLTCYKGPLHLARARLDIPVQGGRATCEGQHNLKPCHADITVTHTPLYPGLQEHKTWPYGRNCYLLVS